MDSHVHINRSSLISKPVSIQPYIDRIQFWLRYPVDQELLNPLKENSGHLYVGNKLSRFDRNFCQRIEFKQPKSAALQWIASRPDALVNRIEVSLDYVFNTERERDEAYDYLDRHRIRRWHGRNSPIHIHPGTAETRYDAARKSRNVTVQYKQSFSRVTGELHVLHVEWRASGKRSVIAAGIEKPADLLGFNHREFWEARLLLVDINPERLGMYLRNSWEGIRAREPEIATWRNREINLSRRRGNVILKSGDNLQEVFDKYSNWIRLERVMTRLPIEEWLPA